MSVVLRKAIIPTAGLGTRVFPLTAVVSKGFFPIIVVDERSSAATGGNDAWVKPVLHVLAEEILVLYTPIVCVTFEMSKDKNFKCRCPAHWPICHHTHTYI